jgi:hypothetical protein
MTAEKWWKCQDCGKVYKTKPWFEDLLKAADPDTASALLMCTGCNGDLKEIAGPDESH